MQIDAGFIPSEMVQIISHKMALSCQNVIGKNFISFANLNLTSIANLNWSQL